MPRTPPPSRFDYQRFAEIGTRWDDNDIYGHLNNTVHYRIFDTVINSFLLEQGILDFRDGEQVFLIIETGCQYFAELAYPDKIDAGYRVAYLGTSSVRYEIGLFRQGEDNAAAAGHFIHVNVDKKSRAPQPINAQARACLTALMPG
jgi:acyl-CoA thioester hydrolase